MIGMKRTALFYGALCVSSFASVVNAASIYADEGTSLAIGGRVEARAEHSDSDISDLSRARVNISGETLLGDGISGIGYFEQEFKASENKTRYLYAGGNMDDFITLLKATNIATKPLGGAHSGNMSPETIVAENPDVYIMQTAGWVDKKGNSMSGESSRLRG